ncbi:AAA family ATPase [Dokdonella ginsengisoli]|uniref:AAA family ATPase n=1 Tax=Dokdonella ginsengisoli TaxID=363846 RepID=A0ABV9QXX6_9GAMM
MRAAEKRFANLDEQAERELATVQRLTDRREFSFAGKQEEAQAVIEIIPATSIKCVPMDWVWRGYFARGKFHVIAGPPGVAKTTITMSFAATISSGGYWPCGARAKRGNVVIWSGEDDVADTLVPRLHAAGADLSRVFFIGDTKVGNEVRPFDPANDLPALELEVLRIGDVALIIVDPVVTAVGGDSHKNTEVRRGLQPLVNMADRLGAAVIGISHFSKGSSGRDPVERVTGSIAFGAVARVVMVAAKRSDEEEGPARLFARAKSNIGPDGGGFAYELEQVEVEPGISASVVRWGAALDGTARELLGDFEEIDGGPRNEAAEWLRTELSRGEVPVKKLKAEANGAGASWRTIETAKRDLGVIAERISSGNSGGGYWVWRLPTSNTANTKAASLTTESCGLAELPMVARVPEASKAATPQEFMACGVAVLPIEEVTL